MEIEFAIRGTAKIAHTRRSLSLKRLLANEIDLFFYAAHLLSDDGHTIAEVPTLERRAGLPPIAELHSQ